MNANAPVVCLALALLCSGATATAQLAPAPMRPGWLPPLEHYDKTITAAQRAILKSRLEQIERLVLRVPEISRPVGFEVQPQFEASAGPDGELISSSYALGIYVPSKALNEGCLCLQVFVNPRPESLHPWDQRPKILDEHGDAVYLEEQVAEPRPGSTLVYGRISPHERTFYVVLLTSGGASPFLEVTREQYLKTLIWELGGRGAKTPYQTWLDGAPGRRQAREETAALLPASERAAFLKQQEDGERESTARFKATAEGPQVADPIRARLASLTPAERELPVWVGDAWGYREFLAPKSPNAFHAVRRNPAFYRPAGSPTDARGIEVRISTGLYPVVQHALNDVAMNLDWSALAALLDSPVR
jgi:hypothetical protein